MQPPAAASQLTAARECGRLSWGCRITISKQGAAICTLTCCPLLLCCAVLCCAVLCCAVLQAVNQQPVDVAAERLEAYCALTAAELLGDTGGYQRSLAQLVTLLAQDRDIVSGARGQQGWGV
jgi:hypothetical protein